MNNENLPLATKQALDRSARDLAFEIRPLDPTQAETNVLRVAACREILLRMYRVAVRDAVQQVSEWGPR